MAGKGDKYERQLRQFFFDQGGAAIRIPASGARTTDELPDIFGIMNDTLWACELKYTSEDFARFTKEEINELLYFANLWGAQPVLVCRYSYDKTFYGYPYQDMRNFAGWQDQKTVSFKRDEVDEMLDPMEEVIGEDENLTGGGEYREL